MSWASLYLAAIYLTMIIGYGNTFAYNDFERTFGLVIMIIGGVMMTYSISTVSSIVSSVDAGNAKFQSDMDLLNRIQNEYKIPLDLYL